MANFKLIELKLTEISCMKNCNQRQKRNLRKNGKTIFFKIFTYRYHFNDLQQCTYPLPWHLLHPGSLSLLL